MEVSLGNSGSLLPDLIRVDTDMPMPHFIHCIPGLQKFLKIHKIQGVTNLPH